MKASTEYWISVGIGSLGLILSGLSFLEAKKAKEAAILAGRTVKAQSITIELAEVSQRLASIQLNIDYSGARDALTDAEMKIHRHTASLQVDQDFKNSIDTLRTSLGLANTALEQVIPVPGAPNIPGVVYNAISKHYASICGQLYGIIGLLEKRTIEKK
jgi:hypothetical protein